MTTTFYTENHEWISVEGDIATIGITNYAQEQLGQLVFVELPKIDQTLAAGDPAVVVELVKAASDVYYPVSGRVIEVNDRVAEVPDLANSDPTGGGWSWKMQLSDHIQLAGLLGEADHQALSA